MNKITSNSANIATKEKQQIVTTVKSNTATKTNNSTVDNKISVDNTTLRNILTIVIAKSEVEEDSNIRKRSITDCNKGSQPKVPRPSDKNQHQPYASATGGNDKSGKLLGALVYSTTPPEFGRSCFPG